MELYDGNNFILKMAIKAKTSNTEQAFLITGEEKLCDGKNKIELNEMEEIVSPIVTASESMMKFDKKFLIAALKHYSEKGKIFILAHTHLDSNIVEQADFSAYDIDFEDTIIKLSIQLKYKLPIIFIVVNEKYYEIDGFEKNKKIKNISVRFPYDAIKYNDRNLHIVQEDKKIGWMYYAPKNRLIKLTSKLSKELLDIQKKIDLNQDNKYIGRIFIQTLVGKKVEKYADIVFEKPRNFIECKEINRLQIMVQTECNLQCKYCYANGGSYDYGNMRMNPQKAIRYLKSLLENRVNTINTVMFFGGEPSLLPDTIEAICEYIEKLYINKRILKMPNFCMVSNGVNVSDKMLNIIKKYQIKVTISLDGPKEINDQLRVFKDGCGTFDYVDRNIQRMIQSGIKPALIEVTYTKIHQKNNISEDDIHIYFKKKYHIENIMIADCDGNNQYAIKEGSLIEERLKKHENPLLSNDSYSRADMISIISKLQRSDRFYVNKCNAGIRNLTLMPDGKIYPCHRYLPDKDNKYMMGRFIENKWDFSEYGSTLENILKTDKLHNKNCKKCWTRYLCNQCPYVDISDNLNWNNNRCHLYQKQIETTISKIICLKESKKQYQEFVEKIKEEF